jgi:hypothetical protein
MVVSMGAPVLRQISLMGKGVLDKIAETSGISFERKREIFYNEFNK